MIATRGLVRIVRSGVEMVMAKAQISVPLPELLGGGGFSRKNKV